MQFEQDTLEKVMRARASVSQASEAGHHDCAALRISFMPETGIRSGSVW
jgi:hypothetical protein